MKEIIKKILQFRDERNWQKYQTSKDLLIGLNIEVAELQELFLWKDDSENLELESIKNELADIFIFLIYLSDKFNIDFERAINDKLKIHNDHYPLNLSRNKNTKYTDLNDGENNKNLR